MASLAWHTAIAMTDRHDRPGSGRADGAAGARGPRRDGSDGEVIRPDAGRPGDDPRAADHGDPLDRLAERTVDSVLGFLGRVTKLAGAVAIFTVVTCVAGFLLGLAVFDGGGRVLWIAVGGLAATWAIGTVLAALWRLRVIRRGGHQLVGEVRTLLGGGGASERTVVETVERPDGTTGVIARSRDFGSLRDLASAHPGDVGRLSFALASVTRVPAMLALAVVLGLGFLGLSLIFLVALAV